MERSEWLRSAVMTAAVQRSVAGGEVTPLRDLIPEPYRPEPPKERTKTAQELERESAVAWKALDMMLTGGRGF